MFVTTIFMFILKYPYLTSDINEFVLKIITFAISFKDTVTTLTILELIFVIFVLTLKEFNTSFILGNQIQCVAHKP